MLQKFIWWTGLSDFLVGAGTWAGAIGVAMAAEPVKGQFVRKVSVSTTMGPGAWIHYSTGAELDA